MSEKAPRATFALSDISGPYPLLGAFLVIVESLLGLWMYRAESATERIVAGFFMASLLAAFLIVVSRLQRSTERLQPATVSIPDTPNLPGQLTAGTQLATKQEIEAPEAERIAGPDRSYLINRPSSRWTVRQLTNAQFAGEVLHMEQSARDALLGPQGQGAPEILVFNTRNETEVLPNPGETAVDGRKLPSALTIFLPIRLTILPLERSSAPLFVERPLLHNFSIFVGQLAAQGLMTLKEVRLGTLPKSQRGYCQAELRQEIRNAAVNGREGLDVDSNTTVIAIEGELKDHLLLMNYPSLPGSIDAQLDQDLADLLSLASSFKPLKIVDAAERKKELTAKTEDAFNQFLEENKVEIFTNEFVSALLRYSKEDLDDPNKRAEAIKTMRPFETLARRIQLKDEDFDQFWIALRRAETGDATEFKSLYGAFRETALEGDQPESTALEDSAGRSSAATSAE